MFIILLMASCILAQRTAFYNIEVGPGFSQEVYNYYYPILGKPTYKYSEILDLNGAIGYDMNETFLADFEVNPTFYANSQEIGIFYNLGIKAKLNLFDMNNYLKLKIGYHQLFNINYSVNNNFGIGANLSGGVELTNNINIEIDFKAITGDLMFKNVPVYSTFAEAQSPASNKPISYSNEDCDYDIYSISIRFIYIFKFTANK